MPRQRKQLGCDMKISFRDYVEYRDSNPVLQEGLWDGIKSAWSSFKNWWSKKPSQGSVLNKPAGGGEMDQKLEKERQARLGVEAGEVLSRLDKPFKDAALIRDLRQRLVSSGVDPKFLGDDKLKGYVDEILSTTRQGNQRAIKIQQIINSFKGRGNPQGSNDAEVASKSLMQIAQAFGGKFPSRWRASIKIRKDGSVFISLIDPQGISRDFGINDVDEMVHLIRSYPDDGDDGSNMQYNYLNRG